MNSSSKAKLHAVAEKWIGKKCIVLHVPENLAPGKAADVAEVVIDCMNVYRSPVVVYRPGCGLRVCSLYGGQVWAGVPVHHPRALPFCPWWKETKIRLAV